MTCLSGEGGPATSRASGLSVTFDHRDLGFMAGIGLPTDAGLEDLVDLNTRFFRWDVRDRSTTELFEAEAIRVRAVDQQGNHVISVQGFSGGEAFILTTTAPSAERLEAFLPYWEAMIASIAGTER